MSYLTEFGVFLTGIAALIGAGITALNFRRLTTIRLELNSRLSQLLTSAHNSGIVQERAAQDARELAKSKLALELSRSKLALTSAPVGEPE